MSSAVLISISLGYVALLFAVAFAVEKWGRPGWLQQRSGLVYALSLAVYCTAWTFYGSVGRASLEGLDFLAIYFGPTLMMPFWSLLVRKMVRLAKDNSITSVADFLAARYGKQQGIGTLVALVLVLGIVPYISLQIKAITDSFMVLTTGQIARDVVWYSDPGLLTTIFLFLFTILYGARYLHGNRPKKGMVTVIAFESLFKLTAFLAVGIFVSFSLYRSPADLFQQAAEVLPNFDDLITVSSGKGLTDWFLLLLISGLAVVLLPRQFQMAVVENTNEQDLKTAQWVFPLYLLLINLFVLPVALAGLLLPASLPADYTILGLSLESGSGLAVWVYLGGFSAATSMIIVSTLALGNMLSNNILLPILIQLRKEKSMHKRIVWTKRISIGVVLLLAYLYYHNLALSETLLSIGIISFIAVAQLAPALIGGIYWKNATSKGAWAGILGGIFIWFYTLILPAFASDLGNSLWITPTNIAQIQELTPTSNAIIFSLLVNFGLFAGVSLYSSPSASEKTQGELFVDVFKFTNEQPNRYISSAHFPSLKSLLIQFLGGKRTEEVLDRYARMHQIDWKVNPQADSRVIAYAERLLTEAIGPASARIMIASVVQEEVLSMQEVVSMLQESQEVLQLNKQLKSQSMQLQKLTSDLQLANEQMKAMGLLKDDFLYTVTHELRTPLTSIRAQAEILLDTDDITDEERNFFLSTIVKDCERLTRLITDVLDLEKFESGNQKMQLTFEQLPELVQEAIDSTQNLIKTKSIELQVDMPKDLPKTYLDRDRIIQVLVNLLSNAIKFCDTESGKIGISVYQINNKLKVNVLDNGQGISPDQETRIFEKFYQAQNQLRLKPTGTGLGLAICKNIITHHLGSIYVKRVSEGTRFSFEIPIFNSLQHFIKAYENTLQKDFDRG